MSPNTDGQHAQGRDCFLQLHCSNIQYLLQPHCQSLHHQTSWCIAWLNRTDLYLILSALSPRIVPNFLSMTKSYQLFKNQLKCPMLSTLTSGKAHSLRMPTALSNTAGHWWSHPSVAPCRVSVTLGKIRTADSALSIAQRAALRKSCESGLVRTEWCSCVVLHPMLLLRNVWPCPLCTFPLSFY